MKLNNKGYSIVEMFAVIVIVSVVLLPLLNTLVNNITTNAIYHERRAAVNIAQGTLEGFQRISFGELQTLIEAQNTSGEYFLELSAQTSIDDPDAAADCADLSGSSNALCQQLFSATWSNFNAGPDQFKVFFYNYRMTEEMQNVLLAEDRIPDEVKNHIRDLETTLEANPDLYYAICWIQYDTDTGSDLIMEGLISDD